MQLSLTRRNGAMSMSQRSHSAAPSESYRTSNLQRRGSLSPTDDLYQDYTAALPVHQQQYSSRFQSRSATATPTGSPKKRQLPQIPGQSSSTGGIGSGSGGSSSRAALLRDRLTQDFDERGMSGGGSGTSGGRFSRYRTRQPHHHHHHSHHQQTYRSTGMGGWERHYTGLSDSDLTMHSLETRLRPRHSMSPDKDFMGDFGDSDMESVVSVTSSAFSTQSERPRGSRGIEYDVRDRHGGDRGGGRGHSSSQSSRDAYRERRERDPERNLSDQSRDQQSSGSFNRSMSNTDITPDDKVGMYNDILNR